MGDKSYQYVTPNGQINATMSVDPTTEVTTFGSGAAPMVTARHPFDHLGNARDVSGLVPAGCV